MPGVGVSIGLTRLFYKLNELGLLDTNKKSIAKVLIIPMLEDSKKAIEIGSMLRKNNVNTEIYLNEKKLKAKMKYADKLEIPFVIVIGEDEIKTNNIHLKNMQTGEETKFNINENISDLIDKINNK